VNCFRAQQLVSPYLDQRLTGAEMLEMQQHLAGCRCCAQEYQEARQTKILLRSLQSSHPTGTLETRIFTRLAQEDRGLQIAWATPAFSELLPSLMPIPGAGAAPRGRRLATALALSCLTVLTIAAPFAPSSADIASRDRAASTALGQSFAWGLTPRPALAATALNTPFLHSALTDNDTASAAPVILTTSTSSPSRQDVNLLRQYVQPPLTEPAAEPLGDEAVSGYVVLSDFQH
jgi:predicted anti-sigma-YlaC factor YlaD